jgi:putative ABC transport system ATP-binding protein
MSSEIAIELQNVRKEYGRDGIGVVALADVSLQIPKGEFFCLMGPSGSGKSTLLHLVACIDRPSQGTVRVFGDDLSTLTDKQKARWRSENVGYVFQTFNLIPVLTALENVELPLLLTNLTKAKRREQARRALSIVSLEDRLDHYPRQLSGGQEQRVAIARAIVTDPAIILADEPTGDLDATSAKDVLTILSSLNEKYQKTIVMVTHDPHAAQYAHKSRYLEKGDLLPEGQAPQ